MGFGAIFAGILFLLNPCIRTLDFLPDAVGCLLLLLGLSKLSYLDERLCDARKSIVLLFFAEAAKLPLSLLFALRYKKMLLPASFVFAVVEAVLMIPFFVRLFGGVEYLVGRKMPESRVGIHEKRGESASLLCFVFSIARALGSFVPELLVLGEQTDSFDYSFRPTPAQNAAMTKPYVEILCFVVVLVLGIYCAVLCGRFFLGLLKDKDFVAALGTMYGEEAKKLDASRFVRTLSLGLGIAFCAFALLFNEVLNFRELLPNVFAYAFFLAAFLVLTRLSDKKHFGILALLVPLVPLSLYNTHIRGEWLSGTDIDIIGDVMTVVRVPERLCSASSLRTSLFTLCAEYGLLLVFLVLGYVYIRRLPRLRNDEYISINELLLGFFTLCNFVCAVLFSYGTFERNYYSYLTGDIGVYIRYDNVAAIGEWGYLISFVIMLYAVFKVKGELCEAAGEKEG